MMLHTMPWWGIKLELTLMRLHATCAESSSVLDNFVLSLNTSGMEDNIENDMENVTKDHEECFKEFTPNMPQTNSVWIRLGSEHAYCSCLSHTVITKQQTKLFVSFLFVKHLKREPLRGCVITTAHAMIQKTIKRKSTDSI